MGIASSLDDAAAKPSIPKIGIVTGTQQAPTLSGAKLAANNHLATSCNRTPPVIHAIRVQPGQTTFDSHGGWSAAHSEIEARGNMSPHGRQITRRARIEREGQVVWQRQVEVHGDDGTLFAKVGQKY